MEDLIIRPDLVLSSAGPFLAAAELTRDAVRVTPSHSHERGQLVGALHGLISIGLDRQQWVVPAVHAIWIPPHWMHSLRSFGPFAGWSVFVAEHRCAELPAEPRSIKTTPLLREAARRAATWPGTTLNAVQTRVAEVILDEVANSRPEALGLLQPADARLIRIADTLAADLSNSRNLEDWAAWAGLSPRTLSRHWWAETGMTFAQWRQQARLLRALELIADRVPVTNIALELGYDNVSAFIEMFRRALGTTPGRYLAAETAAQATAR
ncbi:AraC family transcriptional regulator [Silvimonas amylolytica]|uniref:AraC family transcriptional regulator n=1 Tax=Silvimonas amylolytica TaxID=449663 RepID=A0ABQ2PS40_9NEIS|nr:helix-turn-helix transcriptional regulator [Silvimonas amylolytica]GGP27951.1 AraC family transcriptional regulator [Silvimonas amylolytica]